MLRPLLLLLLLPGLVLGAGWDLRICAHDVLGSQGCCALEPACCSEAPASEERVSEPTHPCSACCIDIASSAERSSPAPERAVKVLERSQDAALLASVAALAPPAAERTVVEPVGVPCDAPGRRTPLPLRL